MGDLNDIMHPNEKAGPGRPDIMRINAFCNHVKQCGFIDLGYSGPDYTWTNRRHNTTPTFERLDRCLANAEWCTAYPNTTVYHLPMLCSDHAPILTLLNSSRRCTNKPFRFENWWLMEQEYEQVAQTSWQRSNNRPFH
jgi:endonuclease/exonuclease/phosphatase family metal-dependent hydrolase